MCKAFQLFDKAKKLIESYESPLQVLWLNKGEKGMVAHIAVPKEAFEALDKAVKACRGDIEGT